MRAVRAVIQPASLITERERERERGERRDRGREEEREKERGRGGGEGGGKEGMMINLGCVIEKIILFDLERSLASPMHNLQNWQLHVSQSLFSITLNFY